MVRKSKVTCSAAVKEVNVGINERLDCSMINPSQIGDIPYNVNIQLALYDVWINRSNAILAFTLIDPS